MSADLKSIVDRVNRLMDERDGLTVDIRDIYAEAKGRGYIPKALRKVVARMRMDPATLAEDDALLETYEAALGRVGKAMRAVREGATLDDAAEANGVHRATLARARAVAKSGGNATVAKDDENATLTETAGTACSRPGDGDRPSEPEGAAQAGPVSNLDRARALIVDGKPPTVQAVTLALGCGLDEAAALCRTLDAEAPRLHSIIVGNVEYVMPPNTGSEAGSLPPPAEDDLAIPSFLDRRRA